MPNWKKVIVSGSDAALHSLNVTTAVTASIVSASAGIITDNVQFNTNTSTSVAPGQLAWNSSDGTLDLGIGYSDVVLQIGQEQHYVVRNETGATIQNGTALYANGVTAGSGRITAAPFTADGAVREVRFLGLATQDISNGVNGIVTHFGYVRDLDTRGTAASSIAVGDEDWSVGDILYAHPTAAGKLTNIPPKHEISVAIVIVRHQNVGVLFVRPTSYGHLDDIHDVNINTGSLATGDLLIYDSGSDYWINSKQLSGSYSLTGSLNATSFTGSLLGNASTATSASFATSASLAATSQRVAIPLSSGYTGYLEASGTGFRLQHSNSGTHISLNSSNTTGFSQVCSFSNGVNITPGGNSTSYGLIITSGSYPTATLLRAGVNTLVVTGSRVGIGTTTPSSSLHVAGTTLLSNTTGTSNGSTLTVYGSGSTQPVLTVQGSQGELFSITDSLSGSLFSVNDISGLPILEVFSDNTILMGSYIAPSLNTTTKTTTTVGSNTIYTIPTASYNGAFFEYTAVSASNARAGSIMAIHNAGTVRFTETTTTDIGTTAGLAFTVIQTGGNIALTGSSATAGWIVKTIVRSI
jgi:hypothetical protein